MINIRARYESQNRLPRQGIRWALHHWLMPVLALGAMAGCYRATGFQRNPAAAEVLPAFGGDAVLGIKHKGGQGDYYLGNDFIQIAIDGTPYGDPVQTPLAGAVSGGSIIDAGYLELDNSYNRVSVPGNTMNRLTPVVNQDPNLPVVFSTFVLGNQNDQASITLTGSIYDPGNLLGAGTSAASPVVQGVAVTELITIEQLDRYFTFTTIVTNNTSGALPIRSVGDCLVQQGSGYTFNVPANFDYQGNALASRWGMQIPGSDFTQPLQTSVQAAYVGLIGREPGADTVDSHASLGFLPLDSERLLVAADPQNLMTVPDRPVVPARLSVGSLPVPQLAGNGTSLSFNRRLYIVGGPSASVNVVGGLYINAPYPDQGTGLFNLMDSDRYGDTNIRPARDTGILTFTLSGTSQRQGPSPTEVRIERNVLAGVPGAPAAGSWQVQRVEWFEPNENLVQTSGLAPSALRINLPVGFYRMVLTSPGGAQTRTLFDNSKPVPNDSGVTQVGLAGPIWIQKNLEFVVDPQDVLCPDVANDASGTSNLFGPFTSNPYSVHYFVTREENGALNVLQPLRFTFTGTPAVAMRRQRTLGSVWDPGSNVVGVAPGIVPGQVQYRGGNEMFGTGFCRLLPTEFAWLPNGGTYTVYGTRGPLEPLYQTTFQTFDGQPDVHHTFTVFPLGLPPGWTSFDLPGPGQATTGGTLTGEKLASGMANGVQVVGHTEQDMLVDPDQVYTNFHAEFLSTFLQPQQIPASLSAIHRPRDQEFGRDPFVVAGRTTTLPGFGTATALFTPAPTSARLGGAALPQPGQTWNLADFLAQGLGQYNVVHRPRGPQGLFTLQGAPIQPTPPASSWNTALNAWWSPWSQQSGPLAFGLTFGQFDALELLRGESFDPTAPAAWFNEFLQVRADWFALLNYQTPAFFTKALGLSSATFSLDTPVGLARTYLKASLLQEADTTNVLAALKAGAAVASTGPFLDVSVAGAGPGGLVQSPGATSVNLAINLWMTDWMPVDEVRVIVNGIQTPVTLNGTSMTSISPASLVQAGSDPRLFTATVQVPMPTGGTDAWIVVEAGIPLTGAYGLATQSLVPVWNAIMRGIYPIAVTNPVFVQVTTGGSYIHPGT